MTTTPPSGTGDAVTAARAEPRQELIGGPLTREAKLAFALVELADTLVADFDVVDLLSRLTSRCVDVLEVSAAGIMLVAPDGELRVIASSDETVRLLELFELQAQEGPCVDCFRTGAPVVNRDLQSAASRWPRFAVQAERAGYASVHALPMRLRGTVLGALNLFDEAPGRLSQADVDAGQSLADIASIAILQHRAALEARVVIEQLNNALSSRIVIEQAKDLVAEGRHVDLQTAFRLLQNHARNHNLRLADLANSIVARSISASSLDPLPRPT